MKRRIHIQRAGSEDRVTEGTKADRREKPSLGVRIRYGIAIVAAGIACYFAWHALDASQGQIRRVLMQSCQRGDTKTRSDNNAHLGDYVVFSFVAARFLVPTHTETTKQKSITSAFASKLHAAVANSSWTPVTDCRRAVSEQGASYKSPVPVLFTTRLPPASALPKRIVSVPRQKPRGSLTRDAHIIRPTTN